MVDAGKGFVKDGNKKQAARTRHSQIVDAWKGKEEIDSSLVWSA